MNRLEAQKTLFGNLFSLANKMQVLGDKYLAEDNMTIRQWFLTVTILQFGENTPNLNDVAEKMGTTRQNVKQLANKLSEKGFIVEEPDKSDARSTRLKLTEKSELFWREREAKDAVFIAELFKDLTLDELSTMTKGFEKLLNKVREMTEIS